MCTSVSISSSDSDVVRNLWCRSTPSGNLVWPHPFSILITDELLHKASCQQSMEGGLLPGLCNSVHLLEEP